MNLSRRFAVIGLLTATLPLAACDRQSSAETQKQKPPVVMVEATEIDVQRRISACLADGGLFEITGRQVIAVPTLDVEDPAKREKLKSAVNAYGAALDHIFSEALKTKTYNQAADMNAWKPEVSDSLAVAYDLVQREFEEIIGSRRFMFNNLELADAILYKSAPECGRTKGFHRAAEHVIT